MKCSKSQILLSQRSHGELDAVAEVALREHLERCADCRRIASEFENVDFLLRDSVPPLMPPLLHQKIVSRVTEEMRDDALRGRRGRFGSIFRRLGAALTFAALAAGICLGVMIGWNLSQSLDTTMVASTCDLISMAGLDINGQDSVLDAPGLGRNGGVAR
jgi:predicted anti-sigma-YlaC factor YlaD